MRDIEYMEDLIDKVEKLFAHGHSRAKNHDQRLGQWIINKIRTKNWTQSNINMSDEQIVRILFNLENRELWELMRDYND